MGLPARIGRPATQASQCCCPSHPYSSHSSRWLFGMVPPACLHTMLHGLHASLDQLHPSPAECQTEVTSVQQPDSQTSSSKQEDALMAALSVCKMTKTGLSLWMQRFTTQADGRSEAIGPGSGGCQVALVPAQQ